jgi:hypothetical protein
MRQSSITIIHCATRAVVESAGRTRIGHGSICGADRRHNVRTSPYNSTTPQPIA